MGCCVATTDDNGRGAIESREKGFKGQGAGVRGGAARLPTGLIIVLGLRRFVRNSGSIRSVLGLGHLVGVALVDNGVALRWLDAWQESVPRGGTSECCRAS